jgi:archaellum component FlaC
MWAPGDASSNGRRSSPAAQKAVPDASPTPSSSAGVWGFDASPFDAPATTSVTATSSHSVSSVSSASHGGIGAGSGFLHSHVSKSRLLWNRTGPEEEEREEEALPSYLTYLQPAFRSSSVSSLSEGGRISAASASSTSLTWGDETLASTSSLSANSSHFVPSSAASAFGALSPAAGAFVSASQHAHHHHQGSSTYGTTGTTGGNVETKSKELAFALQEFVRQQVEQQQQQQRLPNLANGGSTGPCNCEPLKLRVSDLEQKLLVLQQQIHGLMTSNGSASPSGSSGGPPGIHAPPPPPVMMQHPPLPPTPPHSMGGFGGGAAPTPTSSIDSSASGVTDRVSTLEGRQSAFQSQLAQISKVLGVPIGKHGKNSQIKNLVQTLREEIDTKLSTATKDIETKCIATATQELSEMVTRVVDERLQESTNQSSPQQLPYEAVFGALAEEHEASLGKLSAYFEDRLSQESKQRVGLESRIQSRLGEHEEWLQQLEGEFGSWHDRSSTVASQLRVLQSKITEMDAKWAAEQLKWSKLASDIQLGAVGQTSTANGATAMSVTTTTTTTTTVETLTRSVHQLQAQYKQFHSEYKTETSELRENLVLMDTWVKSSRQETRDLGKSVKGMKQLVEKLVRDTGSAEELLQQYVSTITHQVASVTRQYVSVRIRDNNRLIDATMRARVPAYVANESESFMLVRPEKKEGSAVLKDDDEDGIQKLLKQHVENAVAASAGTSRESSGSSSPSKGGDK